MKESTRVLLALGAGLGGGAAIAASGSTAWLHVADTIAPIGTMWVNAIRMTVIPLVISLLITGVASASDLKTIGRIGRRTLIVFGLLLLGVATVAMPILSSVFTRLAQPRRSSRPSGGSRGGSQSDRHRRSEPERRRMAYLAPPIQPHRRCRQRRHGAAGALYPAARARHRAQPRQHEKTLVDFFQALGDAMLVMVRWVIAAAPIGWYLHSRFRWEARGGSGLAGAMGFYVSPHI